MKLKALFDMPAQHLRGIVARAEAIAGIKFDATITPALNPRRATYVLGQAQAVMAVIGAVADHGEDTLRHVTRTL